MAFDILTLLTSPLMYTLAFLSFTAVLFFLLGKFHQSFFRGFSLLDREKLVLVSNIFSVASIILSIYIIYMQYMLLF